LELRRLKYGEARGPRVHLSNKLFLGVSRRNVYGSQKAELKIAWREAQKKKKKKVLFVAFKA